MANLNDKQIEAIEADENVVLIIAGAGSGKTTVLTEKIKRLVESGADPKSILAITFTNKATKEMKERLFDNLGPLATELNIYTFHGLSVLIIRENMKYLPFHSHNFNIIDEDDKKKILTTIIKDNNYDFKVNDVRFTISHAKSFTKSRRDTIELIYDFDMKEIYQKYQAYLEKNNSFDFDDLLLYAYELLHIDDVASRYKQRFKYLHVDEFQDTSLIQSEMLKLIKGKESKLFIVGDVDQSIYEWRGAKIENIMNVEKEYNDIKIVKLEQNYRSTSSILNSANSLIEYNKNRYDKELWTSNPKGQNIKAYRFRTDSNQADFVKSEIKYLEDFGTNLDEIAVLYRFNYQSKRIEEALIRANIAYKIYGGLRFYDRMEVKDVLSYIRLISNQDDNISFLRVVNVPKRKVGDATLSKIRAYSDNHEISYFKAAKEIGNPSLKKFCEIVESYSEIIEDDFITHFKLFLNDIGYEDYLRKLDDEDVVNERMMNVEQVYYSVSDALENGYDLIDYLNELVLFTDNEQTETDAVVLSTIHGVKGLEFENVFLIGICETIFPRDDKSIAELEEERRIMYVAITRAKKKLTLTNYCYNYSGNYLENSKFIAEMGIEDIEEKEQVGFSIF